MEGIEYCQMHYKLYGFFLKANLTSPQGLAVHVVVDLSDLPRGVDSVNARRRSATPHRRSRASSNKLSAPFVSLRCSQGVQRFQFSKLRRFDCCMVYKHCCYFTCISVPSVCRFDVGFIAAMPVARVWAEATWLREVTIPDCIEASTALSS